MKRVVLAVALAVGFVAGLGLAALPAQADSVTYLKVEPANGSTAQAIELDLPDGAYCPAEADRVIARLSGGNLKAPMNVTSNTAVRALDTKSKPGTAILPLLWTLQTTGGKVSPPVVLDGHFDLTVSCLAGLSQDSLGDTIASIDIDAAAATYIVTTPQPAAEPASEASAAQVPSGDQGAAPASEGAHATAQSETSEGAQAPASAADAPRDQQPSDGEVVQDQGVNAGVPQAQQAVNPDTAALDALAASNTVAAEQASDEASVLQPLLIAAGVLLLAVVGLMALRSRRQAS